MNAFLKLFGTNPKEIKEDVIITPFLNLEYFRIEKNGKINKGFLFEVLAERYFSVVKTGIGAPFVGDSIVFLKDTPCKRVYFLGSCGAVSNFTPLEKTTKKIGSRENSLMGFDIGDLVIVDKALAWESFSEMLRGVTANFLVHTEDNLCQNFLKSNKHIKRVKAATLGSLSLQEKVLPLLEKQEVDVVDMEASSFVSAAKYFKLPSLALLYVTDILASKPFFRDLSEEERSAIQNSRRKAISLLCNFIMKQNA